MQKLALILSLLSAFNCMAVAVDDLLFQTPKGRIFGKSSFLYQSIGEEGEYTTGSKINEISTSNMILVQELRYGLLNRLDLGVRAGVVVVGDIETQVTSGSETTIAQSGFQDVDIIGKFRLLDKANSFASLDIDFEYSPSLGDAEEGTTSVDGNAFRGSSRYSLGVSLADSTQFFEWLVGINYNTIGEADIMSASTGAASSTIDAYSEMTLRLAMQLTMTETNTFDFELNAIMFDDLVETNASTNVKTTIDGGTDFKLTGRYNHGFSSEFFLSPSLSYTKGADLVKTTPAETTNVTARSEFEFRFDLTYMF